MVISGGNLGITQSEARHDGGQGIGLLSWSRDFDHGSQEDRVYCLVRRGVRGFGGFGVQQRK